MQLPQFNFNDRTLSMMSTQWRSILNPVLANPISNPRILKNINLKSGVNVINTGIQQLQQGWIVSDINAVATIYRSQPFNETTLTLTSSAPCTVTLVVY